MRPLPEPGDGLVEVTRQARLPEYENLLILVDQFEEIFRFKHKSSHKTSDEEAAEFIKLLLAGATSPDVPIYVVLTMRSDFIGECGQFEGLAEQVNSVVFLILKLNNNK